MSDRRLFALSDLHLSLASSKPMDVFGPRWENYVARIRENWEATVRDRDVVLVSGDISWGMRLEEALPDLRWIESLPGEKVFVKGNHDYWWQGVGKIRGLGLKGMYFVQNDCQALKGVAVGGSRMWDFPGIWWRYEKGPELAKEGAASSGERKRGEDDDKVRERELGRLALSLGKIPKDGRVKVALTHFPPLGDDGGATAITELVNSFGIDLCVFGHVHALPEGGAPPGADVEIGGTRFVLASSDFLNHTPKYLCDI